jgi:hypothetical protein
MIGSKFITFDLFYWNHLWIPNPQVPPIELRIGNSWGQLVGEVEWIDTTKKKNR